MTAHKPLVGLAALVALGAPMMLVTSPADAAARQFSNCTAMHRVYPHGVGLRGAHDRTASGSDPVTNFARRPRVYRANRSSDRDHDHVACEAH